MSQAFATHEYIAQAVEEIAAQGECLDQATEAAPKAAVKRLPWLAATLAILLHATLLLLGFWLSGGTRGTQTESLPSFISISLDSWPSEEEAGRHQAAPAKESALPPGNAAGQNRVSPSAKTGKKISRENPAQDNSGGFAEEGTRLPEPASGGNNLSMQPSPGRGSGTAAGDQQGALPEILARPLYEKNPPPLYPRLAKRLGKQGIVQLEVFVAATGTAAEVKVAIGSGHEILDEAALESVRGWRFAPGLRNGQPVGMWVRVPVRFALQG